MATQAFDRLVQDFEAAWNSDLRDADVRAMVMGPSLRGRVEEKTRPARDMRRAIARRCAELGVAVLPEHKRLMAVTEEALREANNLCIHELKLLRVCDLVVIVPASPGPLVELGMFAERPCLKDKSVLIVFDRTYRWKKSFINHGPRKAYTRSKSQIVDVNYANPDDVKRVLAIVESLVRDERANKVAKEL